MKHTKIIIAKIKNNNNNKYQFAYYAEIIN